MAKLNNTNIRILDPSAYFTNMIPGATDYRNKFQNGTERIVRLSFDSIVAPITTPARVVALSTNELPGTSIPTLHLVSTSEEDGVDGEGALTVVVFGLDVNGQWVLATYTMNGTTNVDVTGFKRLNYFIVGSGAPAVGDITLKDETDTTTYRTIAAGATFSDGRIFIEEDSDLFVLLTIGGQVITRTSQSANITLGCGYEWSNGVTEFYQDRSINSSVPYLGAGDFCVNMVDPDTYPLCEFIPYKQGIHSAEVLADVAYTLVCRKQSDTNKTI